MSGASSDPRLAKYRLDRVLGVGGMGSVRLARDLELNRDVAIKFIAPEHAGNAEWARRLVREAQLAAALDHPGICAVYEVSAEPGHPAFIVMQYVEGETLGARVRRAPMDPRDALKLTAGIADALWAAHRAGIVHRDLKPDNVMITPSGRSKLLDFGVARMPALAGYEGTRTSLTVEGSVVGTPSYMSPEQIEQRSLDGRSDLFSLGCLLYECLTGRPAFTAATPIEIYAAVLHVHPAPPSAVRPELSTKYDELCRRLLAKDPAARFQNAQEVVAAIQALLPDTNIPSEYDTRPAPGPRPPYAIDKRILVGVAAALTVAAVAGVWWYAATRTPPPLPEAARWYAQGVEHLRSAAYHSARKAFEEAIRLSPSYAQAYTRLAEAHIELDEESEAKDALLHVDSARLDGDDRLRYDAVSALATGRQESAVALFRQLAAESKTDAGIWVDLGRAQQAAGVLVEARGSFQRALQIDGQYAAAHLNMGMLGSAALPRDETLTRFSDAERLYTAASNVEGQTEVVLRRGLYLASVNELDLARPALEQARVLADGQQNRAQEIRSELGLAAITAARGNLTQAEAQARAAVNRALDARLDTVAANGLVDLGAVLLRKGQLPEAKAHLEQALQLATRRRAPRSTLRTRLQLASLALTGGNWAEAQSEAESMLAELRARGYRRFELNALNIAARAHEYLGNIARARGLTHEAMEVAERLGDEAQAALALDNLAGQLKIIGHLPEALSYRERVEAIHRRQKDNDKLAFDLQNRAEILIRLGRGQEADAPLKELEAGAAAGIETFQRRARRVLQLRALHATVDERFDDAARLAFEVVRAERDVDATTILSVALLEHAIARGGRAPGSWARPSNAPPLSNADTRELRYLQLSALAARGDRQATAAAARAALQELGAVLSCEDRWRIAAIGAAAARGRDGNAAALFGALATKSLEELRTTWQGHTDQYLKRPDLVRLRAQAGLTAAAH